MKKKILLVLFFVFFFCFNDIKSLSYGGCEYSQISRLKSLVSNVNITYDYYIQNKRAYFNIKLTNLVPELYFIDSNSNKKYTYANTNNGELVIYGQTYTQGSYKFYSNLNNCMGVKLSTKYYNLPEYNIYFGSELCEGIENSKLCQKWIKNNYSYKEFEKKVIEYKEAQQPKQEDEVDIVYEKTFLTYFIDFYVKYYYFLLFGIIVICFVIMNINKKRNRFDI